MIPLSLSIPSLIISSTIQIEIDVTKDTVEDMMGDIGPTQAKCWLLISCIFDAMNFHLFFEMLEIMLQHFLKSWKFIASKMLEIKSQHLTWGGP